MSSKQNTPALPSRFVTLDLMRGYFIVMIIINHLWRWPNAFIAISGANLLWFSGAEGFVILSGFLIGYVRGYKGLKSKLKDVSKKLLHRSIMLYMWLIVTTILLTVIFWNTTFLASAPWIPIEPGDYKSLIINTLTLGFAHNWVYFLYLYAVLIFLSPILVLLLRKNLTWLAAMLTAGLYAMGNLYSVEWMQWSPVFYLPMLFGFHLPTIAAWWHNLSYRKALRNITITLTLVLLTISVLFIFAFSHIPEISHINQYMSKDGGISVGRLAMAAVCFMGLYFLFNLAHKWIDKYFGWLLRPFGNWSLAAYALHGFVISGLSIFISQRGNIIINTVVTAAAIIITWSIVALKPLQRVLPK